MSVTGATILSPDVGCVCVCVSGSVFLIEMDLLCECHLRRSVLYLAHGDSKRIYLLERLARGNKKINRADLARTGRLQELLNVKSVETQEHKSVCYKYSLKCHTTVAPDGKQLYRHEHACVCVC